MLRVISQIFQFQALPQSLDSSSLSWHLKRDQRGPGVLLQERLNQRCHERGLISKALNYTWIRKDVVMVELLSSGGEGMKGNSQLTSVTHRVRMREPPSSEQLSKASPCSRAFGRLLITLMSTKSHLQPKRWIFKFKDAFFGSQK